MAVLKQSVIEIAVHECSYSYIATPSCACVIRINNSYLHGCMYPALHNDYYIDDCNLYICNWLHNSSVATYYIYMYMASYV